MYKDLPPLFEDFRVFLQVLLAEADIAFEPRVGFVYPSVQNQRVYDPENEFYCHPVNGVAGGVGHYELNDDLCHIHTLKASGYDIVLLVGAEQVLPIIDEVTYQT